VIDALDLGRPGSSRTEIFIWKCKSKNLPQTKTHLIGEVAAMLIEGFRKRAPDAFPDLQTAIAEVRESFAADRVTRVAVDDHAQSGKARRP